MNILILCHGAMRSLFFLPFLFLLLHQVSIDRMRAFTQRTAVATLPAAAVVVAGGALSSSTRTAAMRATPVALNFFPLGLKSGPKNLEHMLAVNSFDPKQVNNVPKHLSDDNRNPRPGFVPKREDLKLHCECCQFTWIYDALAVRCTAHPTVHNQQEIWLSPVWMYERQQPVKYYRHMNLSRNPRTGAIVARETAKGMNTERRAAGLTTRTMNIQKERSGISRAVSKIGSYSQRWQVRFPFPT